MIQKYNKIVTFDEFYRLRRSIHLSLLASMLLILSANSCVLCSMTPSLIQLIPIGGVIACIMFCVLYVMINKRMLHTRDGFLLVEWISACLMLLLSCIPFALYLYLNGNWSALSSLECFLMYYSWGNVALPLSLIFLVLYLYVLLMTLLYKGSIVYYDCVKYKQNNE